MVYLRRGHSCRAYAAFGPADAPAGWRFIVGGIEIAMSEVISLLGQGAEDEKKRRYNEAPFCWRSFGRGYGASFACSDTAA